MKRSLLAASAMLLMATTAQATQVQRGAWTIYDSPGNAGRPICGVYVTGDYRRSLHIKYVLGDEHLTIMMFKPSWRFPTEGVALPLTVWFDSKPYSTDDARGVHFPDSGAAVVTTVPNKLLTEFLNQFSEAKQMAVKFDSGNEPPWTVNMNGSREAATLFKGCIYTLIDKNPMTQPYSQPQTTQPYGKPARPSQPYGNAPKAQPSQPARRDDGGI